MEKIFRMAECTEEEKFVFAANQFRGAAEDWWESAQRRMVANDMEESRVYEDLIGGMCFLGQNPVRVLFDWGATCSFISFQCVETLQLAVSPLNPPMIMTMATDGGIVVNCVCENCPITVSSKTYYIDLVCLPTKLLDVILGMD